MKKMINSAKLSPYITYSKECPPGLQHLAGNGIKRMCMPKMQAGEGFGRIWRCYGAGERNERTDPPRQSPPGNTGACFAMSLGTFLLSCSGLFRTMFGKRRRRD
jgi:hypothetical protein